MVLLVGLRRRGWDRVGLDLLGLLVLGFDFGLDFEMLGWGQRYLVCDFQLW